MRLTRKKAIELCIELWTWLAKTGKQKDDWPEWEKYGYSTYDCWFCHYDRQREKKMEISNNAMCNYCPYYKIYGHCYKVLKSKSLKIKKSNYRHWASARSPRTRKKYAGLFLEQIKTLK